MKRSFLALVVSMLTAGFASAQIHGPSWQATLEVQATFGVSSSTAYYTNSSANQEVVTTANFVNTVDIPNDTGGPFSRILLIVETSAGINRAEEVLFPSLAPQNSTDITAPVAYGFANNMCLTLNPGDKIYVEAFRTFTTGATQNETTGHFTLSGYSLSTTASVLGWESIAPITTHASVSNGVNTYDGSTIYTNSSSEGELLSNVSFWANAASATNENVNEIRLYTETLKSAVWTTTGEAVIYPTVTTGQPVISLNVANLGLTLSPGDRVVAVTYSNYYLATGTLTLSGVSFTPAVALADWENMLTLIQPSTKTAVKSNGGYIVNLSTTLGAQITGLNYVDLAEDVTGAGAPFTTLYLYSETLVSDVWTVTGRAVVYIPGFGTGYASAYLNSNAVSLVLNPGDRLVVIADRPGGTDTTHYDANQTGPTTAHLTFTGYTFTPG